MIELGRKAVPGPTGRKVFRVEVEIRKECSYLIEGDSKEDVIAAVEADDLDSYGYDVSTDVLAYEVKVDPAKLPKGDQLLHGTLVGEVHEIAEEEYQAVYGPKADPPPPPPDTVTLPLFPGEEKQGEEKQA